MRQIVRIAVGLLLVALLVGCGGKRPGAVSGKITYKGQPVNDAALRLYPSGGAVTNPITIPVTSQGAFRITDVPPGEYKVVVEGSEGGASEASLRNIPREKLAEVKAMLEPMKSRATIPFPKKYKSPQTTDLKCTIGEKD
jgi:hypothetical protein